MTFDSSSSIEDSSTDSLELELESTTELTDDFGLRLLDFFKSGDSRFFLRRFSLSLLAALLFESFFKSTSDTSVSLDSSSDSSE